LDHPTRRRIVEYLNLLPGDHLRSIVRALHLPLGTTQHHLQVLTDAGVIRAESMGGKKRYFANTTGPTPPRNEAFRHYWKYRDLRARVWSTVLRSGEARPSTVAESLGVSRQLAAYHLSCLAELGLVVRSHGRYQAVSPENQDVDASQPSDVPPEGTDET